MAKEEKFEKEAISSNKAELSDEQLDDVSGGGPSQWAAIKRNGVTQSTSQSAPQNP